MYQALFATSETIRSFIEVGIHDIRFDGTRYNAFLNKPEELRSASHEGVSVWLYRVERDPDRLNDPSLRVGWNELQTPPLPLRLHYLITPITGTGSNGPGLGSSQAEQTLLGKVLQLFHVHPILRGDDLREAFRGTAVELHMRLEPMNLEEITRVWEALEGSYQLSVSYEVSVVNIESDRVPERVEPVAVALPDSGVIVSGS